MPSQKIEAKKPIKKKLTLKQKKFTAEYIKSGNATSAAKKAGYSKKTAKQIATENLSKPAIQVEIQSAAAKLGIDAEYVLGNFKEIADFNKRKVIKTIAKAGLDIIVEEMIDASAAIKSTEMLGKHLSLFTEKLEVTGKDGKDLLPPDTNNLQITAKKIALLLSKANSK